MDGLFSTGNNFYRQNIAILYLVAFYHTVSGLFILLFFLFYL